MIDVATEHLLPIPKAGKEMPGEPHRSTVWRFALRGVRGVRLETVVCGGRRFTSREAIRRFIAATTAAANGEPPARQPTKKRLQDKADAKSILRRAGIVRDDASRTGTHGRVAKAT